MINKSRLIRNTAVLTASALVMRCIALSFQVWIAGRIGSAGIGLFQLVMSVGGLSVTLAISGIRFACTRLVSEEIGMGRAGGIGSAMRRCLGYCLFFGVAACLILYFSSEWIGFIWVGDARTVLPIRIFSLSLPFTSLSAVIAGYFTANARVYKTAAVQILEQLLSICLVALLLVIAPKGDLEITCACVVLGGVAAEAFSCALISTVYLFDRRKYGEKSAPTPKVTTRMLSIALPLAISAYARSSLSTLEHMLVPRGLKSSGLSTEKALSSYGVIQGMVFPIISFPASVMLALAELMVPELTAAQVSGRTDEISRVSGSLLRKSLLFSLTVSAILFTFSRQLGMSIYSSAEAGKYIRIFSLLAPIMFMDMITDGMLKGLGQMMQSMMYNILDAGFSVLLVLFLLPRFQVPGYVFIIFFMECFNFFLSIRRLIIVAKPKFFTRRLPKPKIKKFDYTNK